MFHRLYVANSLFLRENKDLFYVEVLKGSWAVAGRVRVQYFVVSCIVNLFIFSVKPTMMMITVFSFVSRGTSHESVINLYTNSTLNFTFLCKQ